MDCECPVRDGRMTHRMDQFLRDPDVRIITGTKRSGRSAVLDAVERAVFAEYPEDFIIRMDEETPEGMPIQDLGDTLCFFGGCLDKGRRNHVLTDLTRSFSDIGEVLRMLSDRGYAITVYHAVELCHQLPACEKITYRGTCRVSRG